MIPPISPSQGVRWPSIRLPCATLRHIYNPFPRYSWYGFVSLGGFPRPNSVFSKYFLARGNFLLKIWRANYGASRASLGGCTRGVSLLRVASLPCPPVPSVLPWGLLACGLFHHRQQTKRQINGLQTGFCSGGLARLGSVGFICLCAYLVKIGAKGENFQPKFLSLCLSFARPVLSIIRR